MRTEGQRLLLEENTPHRSVAMFAYYFPPCTCWPTASTRAEGLADGLAAHGWSPIVITRANGCPCLDGRAIDDGDPAIPQPSAYGSEIRRIPVRTTSIARLRDRIDRGTAPPFWRSLRAAVRKSLTMLLVLADGRNDWVSVASSEGDRTMRERHVDAVWTTAPPYRAVHIGRRLQRRHHTPWVADLRDSIARSYAGGDVARTGRRLARPVRSLPRRRWMRDLRHAAEVVCVSPQEARLDAAALRRRVGSLPSGFDPATWHDLRQRSQEEDRETDSFRVLYAGSLLPSVQDPDPFLLGVRLFLDKQRAMPAISITYVGPSGTSFNVGAEKAGIGEVFEDLGMVPVHEARTLMCGADLLLLLCPSNGGSGVPGGKLYEYLAAGPPILAIPATDHFVERVLRETIAGDVASTPEDVAQVLARRYGDWQRGQNERRPLEGLSGFTWAARSRQLADLLDQHAGGR